MSFILWKYLILSQCHFARALHGRYCTGYIAVQRGEAAGVKTRLGQGSSVALAGAGGVLRGVERQHTHARTRQLVYQIGRPRYPTRC